MKKIIYIIAALAALTACNKAETDTKTPKDQVLTPVSSLTASSASVTKTSTDGNLQVFWTGGDKIAVYGNKRETDELGTPFTISGSGGGTMATFTSETAVDCAEYGVAVYPYTESDNRNRTLATNGSVYTWVPKTQHYVANSIPTDALVMASRFDPKVGSMTFTALASVLEVKLYGNVSITNIKVEEYSDATTYGGKNLCGRTKITFDDNGVPDVISTETSALNLVCDTPVALNESAADATSFFIVVGGNSSFHHLNLTITDNDSNNHIATVGGAGDQTTLAPGTVYSIPAKEIKKAGSTVLAGWTLTSSGTVDDYKADFMGGLYVASASAISASGTGAASTGSGYIQFKNNDYADGSGSPGTMFRTNLTSTPNLPSFHLCFIPVSLGDEIVLAATNCSLASGDKVQFVGCIWAYANKSNLTKANTSKSYDLEYSLDGSTWTKINDYTFSANTKDMPNGSEGASANFNETVTLNATATQILFRFLATSDKGTGNGGDINATGQTRLCYGATGQLAIVKL